MSRRRFIEAQGATATNWMWSWAFRNDSERFVLFGAWSDLIEADGSALILLHGPDERLGYRDARRCIDLVQNEGYELRYFVQDAKKPIAPAEPRSIARIDEVVRVATLDVRAGGFYAHRAATKQSDIGPGGEFGEPLMEGNARRVTVNSIERNAKARRDCIAFHGCNCKVCAISFGASYGDLGDGFIHVHHIDPLGSASGVRAVDPKVDLIPLCPNCHAMVHRRKPPLTILELKNLIANRQK